ncbi:hypothetical protein Egran_06678 [Elaphomyces granulatus]|uniref:Mid2 domain-containing protein n=1 Tax=Elaphomyces granulatus TaxID=519963 RepID=A0A232LN15_9EURO|nr:hypothetical protein Egran_06678 [Elaphomyces granulatus]
MSDNLVSTSGFALRKNGSCLSTEVDCGTTISPFRACCPGGSFCPNEYNVECCPSATNCTASLLEKPRCANETWDLYDNSGYFCCLQGTTGFATDYNSDGCAVPGYSFTNDTLLSIISSGQGVYQQSPKRTIIPVVFPAGPIPTSYSTSDISSSTSTSATSSTFSAAKTSVTVTSSPASVSSRTNAGAIAGGVVGGLAGLAILLWLLMARRARHQSPNLDEASILKTDSHCHHHHHHHHHHQVAPLILELESQSAALELEG